MSYSYKEILDNFAQIAQHHPQINSYGFGDIEQITNDIETKLEPHYSRLYVIPGKSSLQQNQIQFDFSVIIMDKLNNDLSNMSSVMSDTLQIAQDVWTIFYQSYSQEYGNFSLYVVPNQKAQIIPFTERFETVLGGWTLNISLVMPFNYNWCNVPLNPNNELPQQDRFVSYFNLLNEFESFAALHEQVKSYGYGDLAQFTNDIISKVEPHYVRLYVLAGNSTIQNGQLELNFQVIIADKLNNDLSNRQDVLNDTMEISKDLFAKFYLSYINAEWDASVEPFIERFETVLGGWTLNLTARMKYSYDRCVLPELSFN